MQMVEYYIIFVRHAKRKYASYSWDSLEQDYKPWPLPLNFNYCS